MSCERNSIVSPRLRYDGLTSDHGEYPFEQVGADGWVVEGKGQLGTFRFGGADMYARKSVADPDFVSHSWIHHFEPDGEWVSPTSSIMD